MKTKLGYGIYDIGWELAKYKAKNFGTNHYHRADIFSKTLKNFSILNGKNNSY